MFVVRHMSAPPVTIDAATPVPAVREILNSHNFRHLPVVDGESRLIGMVTDRDLRSAYPSTVAAEEERRATLTALEETQVGSIMSEVRATLSTVSTLDDALTLLDRDKVGALPVLDDDGRVVGVFSIRDLIKAYRILFGLGERGSAMVVVEHDGRPRPLTRIVQVLEEHDIRFTRLVRSRPAEFEEGREIIYLRVHTYNTRAVHAALEEAGFKTYQPKFAARIASQAGDPADRKER